MQRYLIVWLTLLSVVAFAWPRWAGTLGDPFVATRPYLAYLIALIMLVIGCLLPRDELRRVARAWPLVLGGTAIQYTAMPLLAYTLGHWFRLEADLLVGVILVGCVPGAMASNVLTLMARGNVSYSVSLTTSSTLLSPLVVPLALWLALAARHQLDPREVFFNLLGTVVIPVLVGHALAGRFSWLAVGMQRAGPAIANAVILWLIAVVVAVNRERLPQGSAALLGALLSINLLGYLAGYAGGVVMRLDDPMRRALTLEIGMQNAGLGTVLALELFPTQPEAAIPPAIYTFGCMFTGTVLARMWGSSGEGRAESRQGTRME